MPPILGRSLPKPPPWKGITGGGRTPSSGSSNQTSSPSFNSSGGQSQTPVTDLPTGILPVEFSLVNVAASLTASQMYRVLGNGSSTVAAQLSFVTPFKGSVVAITIATTTAVAAGTMTVTAFRLGMTTPAALPITTGTSAFGSWSKGTIPFAAGDTIDLRLTTDSGFLPTTLDVEAFVYLSQEVI